MTISVTWYNVERTILLQTIADHWTLDDYYALSSQTNTLLSSIDYPVDLIADLGGVRTVPTNIVSALRRSEVKHHPNLGLVVVTGLNNTFVYAMYNVFIKLTPSLANKFQLARTLDEAAALIQTHRAEYTLTI